MWWKHNAVSEAFCPGAPQEGECFVALLQVRSSLLYPQGN